ncbi:hypothetical protein pb186bvf_000491 [Paramecium bursaria]
MSSNCLDTSGVQIGDQGWDLSCQEFKVDLDGQSQEIDQDRQIIFNEVKENSFRPRAIFADMEQSPISEIMTGQRKSLYSKNIIEHGIDAGCTYARGFFMVGREIRDNIMDKIRKQIENCNKLDGIIYHSCISGGSGSGLTDNILHDLEISSPKVTKIPIIIMPSPNLQQLVVEPYNAIFALTALQQNQNPCVCVDNEQLYKNCETLDIELPNYQNLNQIIALITNNIIVGNSGCKSNSLRNLYTNLLIKPKIQFLQPSISYYNVEGQIMKQLDQNIMTSYHKADGIALSKALFYRGDFSLNCIQKQKYQILQTDRLNIDRSKIGISDRKMIQFGQLVNQGAFMLQNNLSIMGLFENIMKKFDLLFDKRALVHWYVGEGQDEACFHEDRYNLENLHKLYKEMSKEYNY